MVIDCSDPHAQARFWAAALGWDIEETDASVHKMLDRGQVATDEDVVDIGDGRSGLEDKQQRFVVRPMPGQLEVVC